nr:hypothetical protein CFP56_06344 [Quercus suber]POF25903.1 hypothetical protein CFP56_77595 [Quercus suber]
MRVHKNNFRSLIIFPLIFPTFGGKNLPTLQSEVPAHTGKKVTVISAFYALHYHLILYQMLSQKKRRIC